MELNKVKIGFLISLVVPFLISGPFLPDLLVTFGSIIFLYYLIKNKLFYKFNVLPIKFFLAFCTLCIFSSIISENIFLSLKTSLFYIRFGIFVCLIWYLIDKDKSILNFFYFTLLISFSILSFDAYIQYFNQVNLIGLSPFENNRVSSFFGDELVLGSFLTRLFPLLFACFIARSKKSNFEIYYITILFIAVDVLIFITGERTAFILLNLSTIFIILLIKQFKKLRLFTFVVGLIFCSIITFTDSQLKYRMILSPIKSMGLQNSSSEKYIFSESHDSLIRTALKMFIDRPVLGHGPKMFRYKCDDPKFSVGQYSCSTHPHNTYIQLLAETGIFGFAAFFSIFIYIIICSYKQIMSILFKRNRYLDDYQVCLLGGILISVWPLIPSGNFFNNWLSIIYFLPIGFYLQTIYKKF